MSTTLSDLITSVSRAVRDPDNAVFSTDEITDLINDGIDDASHVYPRELVDYTTVISAGVATYALPSGFETLFRVDIHNASDSYLYSPPAGDGDRDAGWEVFGSIVYFPPSFLPDDGSKVRLFGYGPYTQLSASTQTTDLDTTGIRLIRAYVTATAFDRLAADRALFQQWQTTTNATDISPIALWRLGATSRSEYAALRNRLRRVRR